MELDFSKLNNIASPSAPTQGNVSQPTQPAGSQEDSVSYARLDMEQKAYNNLVEAYREYQTNIRNAGTLQSEILKGMKAGEDTDILLLKACKAIAQMTGNASFYEQVEAELVSIYGEGLQKPVPLQIELETVTDRLNRLEASLERDTLAGDDRSRVERAVEVHKKKQVDIERLIQEGAKRE